MGEYINQHQIDAVAKALQDVSPDLHIEGISSRNSKAFAVYVKIMEKGNKELINKLLALGFTKTDRKKLDDGRCFGTMYDGYSFLLTFRKLL